MKDVKTAVVPDYPNADLGDAVAALASIAGLAESAMKAGVTSLQSRAAAPAPQAVSAEDVARIVKAAIARRMAAETCPVRSFDIKYRMSERDAAVKEATDAILALIPPVDDGLRPSSPVVPTEQAADRWADLERLAKAAAKRAPGLWGSDIEKGEGEYGSGDDDRTGFMVPYMETEHGKRLFDAHYCDVAEIHEDYDCDDDGSTTIYAWDEASREIFNYLAAAQPSQVLELITAARGHSVGIGAADEPKTPTEQAEGAVVGWRPIETAPKDGTLIICFYPERHGHARYSLRYWAGGDWGIRSEGWSDQHRQLRKTDPTHWLPLPSSTPASVSPGTEGGQ